MENEFEESIINYDNNTEGREHFRNPRRDFNAVGHVKKFQSSNNKRRRDDESFESRKRPLDDRFNKRRREEEYKKSPSFNNDAQRRYPRKMNQNQQAFEYPNRNTKQNTNFEGHRNNSQFNDRLKPEFENGSEKISGEKEFRERRRFPHRHKNRCWDYDEQGYCFKGDSCPYEHGEDRIIVGPTGSIDGRTQNHPPSPNLENDQYVPTPKKIKEYKEESNYNNNNNYNQQTSVSQKTKSGWNRGNQSPGRKGDGQNDEKSENFNEDAGEQNENMQESVQTKEYHQPKEGSGGRYNNNNSNYNRGHRQNRYQDNKLRRGPLATTTLLIKKIPPELNTITHLNEHFKKFGTIHNIRVMALNNQALVKFETRSQALECLNSTEAVFGNRHIKVIWARAGDENEEAGDQNSARFHGNSNESVGHHHTPTLSHFKPQPPGSTLKSNSLLTVPHTSPFNPILGKSPAPKKIPSPQEMLKEIQRHKDELRKKQLIQQEKLLEVLEKKTLSSKDRADLMDELKTVTEQLSSSLKKDSSTLESTIKENESRFLKAKEREKERLDRELELMVHSNPKENSTESSGNLSGIFSSPPSGSLPPATTSSSSGVGAASSIGLASASPLGAPTLMSASHSHSIPKRGRGGFRRGGHLRGHSGWSRMIRGSLVLDNRTTSILVSALPPELLDETTLKSHFNVFGEVKDFALNGFDAVVTYTMRKSAETVDSLS
eukprot:TRINITY_DN3811_c0_g1_i2.p1 TRINITY_DN3811_c0_g1~~TRINITY_DN3811_c0_g1_i2.p1  ORF type:complete len:717 (-),score=134.86 TRINITY_DN3811_c0_g1_i2:568-2718(-)